MPSVTKKKMYPTTEAKREIFKQHGGSDTNTGVSESQIALFTLTEDAKEGQKAFQEKRKPVWAGQ